MLLVMNATEPGKLVPALKVALWEVVAGCVEALVRASAG